MVQDLWPHNGFNHTRVKQNFSADGKEFKKVSRAVGKAESHVYRQFIGIWQILNHRTSTPHRSETNGIAQRAVPRAKEGTRAVLLQSGLDEQWWAGSVEYNCYLRNVQNLLADMKTPYERRFGEPFKGLIIPFGATVECYPISARDQSTLHQFGKKVLPGIFLGYALIFDLKNSELEKKFPNYKGRVVLRGDIVKNDFPGTTPYSRSNVLQRQI